jgi:hypothetical protein
MKKNSKQRLLEVMQRVDPSFKSKLNENMLNEGEGGHITVMLDFPKNTSSINVEGRDVANNFPLTEQGLYDALYKVYTSKKYYNLIDVSYVNPRGRSGEHEMDIMTADTDVRLKYLPIDMKDNITELFIEINKGDEPPKGGDGVPAPGAEKQNFRENEDTMYSPKDSYDKNKSYTIADGPFTKKYPQYKGKEVKVIGGIYDGPDSVTVQTLDGTSFTLSPNEIVDANKQGAVMRENGMYESKEKFKFGKSSKKRLFEVMQRVAPNFKGKALNEGGWNLPDNVYDNDPHFNDPGDDDFSDWYLEKSQGHSYPSVVLRSHHSGTHYVDWEYLIPDEEELQPFLNQLNANPKDPALLKKIDALVDEYLQSPSGQTFEWGYPERDEDGYYDD